MQVHITSGGKEIQAFRDSQARWKVQFTSGGQLPEELTGLYTSERNAVNAILQYIDKDKNRKSKKTEE